jgi:hypothetical protein
MRSCSLEQVLGDEAGRVIRLRNSLGMLDDVPASWGDDDVGNGVYIMLG